MNTSSKFLFLLLIVVGACVNIDPNQGASISGTDSLDNDFNKIVGRWAQVAVVINGNDLAKGSLTQDGPIGYYTFNSDSTFVITRADTVREKGKWSINPNVSPKTFDHTDHLENAPYIVPGIYELGEDIFKICIWDPKHGKLHPSRFETKAENGSWILVLKRVPDFKGKSVDK